MLPEAVVPGPARPVLQVLDRLTARDSWAAVLYPLAALREADAEAPVYPKADSRWSGFGAYVAYRELMGALTETIPVRRITRRELRIVDRPQAGDLGEESRFAGVEVLDPRARLVKDNGMRGPGRLIEYRAPSYNAFTCLVFGDRFARRMLPLLAESFERTFWAHADFDYELVRELRPDAVVTVAAEHTMIDVRSDSAPGIRQLEAQGKSASTRPLSQV
jgi:hypothetical protein